MVITWSAWNVWREKVTKEQKQLLKVMKEVRKLADMLGLPRTLEDQKKEEKPVNSEANARAEEIYRYYPKKVGRKKGVLRLTSILARKPAEFTKVSKAVNHYIEYVNDQNARGFDLNFKNFDTWVNCWEDFINPPQTLERERHMEKEKKRLRRQSEKREGENTAEQRAKIDPAEFAALQSRLSDGFSMD